MYFQRPTVLSDIFISSLWKRSVKIGILFSKRLCTEIDGVKTLRAIIKQKIMLRSLERSYGTFTLNWVLKSKFDKGVVATLDSGIVNFFWRHLHFSGSGNGHGKFHYTFIYFVCTHIGVILVLDKIYNKRIFVEGMA